jgi:potassium-dependent mechanosensitive channel
MRIWKIILVVVVLALSFQVSAQSSQNVQSNKTANSSKTAKASKITNGKFEAKDAYLQLDAIKEKLAAPNLSLSDSRHLNSQLRSLRAKAQLCVEKSEGRLKDINKMFTAVDVLSDQDALKKSDEYKYLLERKNKAAKRASDCRLFLFRSQEPVEATNKRIKKLGSNILFKRSMTVWEYFKQGSQLTFKKIDFAKTYQLSKIQVLVKAQLFIALLLAVLAVLIAFFIRSKCGKWLKKRKERAKISVALLAIIKSYIIPLAVFGALSGFLAIIFNKFNIYSSVELVSYCLFGYVLSLTVLSFILAPPKPASSPFIKWPPLGRSFFVRLVFLITLILIGVLFAVIFRMQPRGIILFNLVKTCFFILLSLNVIWVCWLFSKLPVLHKTKTAVFIKIVLFTLLIVMIAAQLLGYHRLTSYLISRTFLSLVALSALWLVIRIIGKIGKFFNTGEGDAAKAIRYNLSLKSGKKLTEFMFIKLAVWLVALYMFVMYILMIWGLSVNTIADIDDATINGFTFANMQLTPLRIVIALLVFGLLLIFGRWIKSYIARHRKITAEKDVQVTMDAIISYIAFGLSFIIASAIAGVNFTGLAVVAGALSVGIGLGLQTIVNNFVSGIILLLDKNIDPGDLVVVNGVEGFVNKVSLRSTQLTTLLNEDIIVPNTEMFTSKVTNYMLHGKVIRLVCKVGVASESDIDFVKEVLLKVTKQVEEILQEKPHVPKVLFNEFSSGVKKFSIFYVVANVKAKNQISSDLNIAIEKGLKQNNIEVNSIV